MVDTDTSGSERAEMNTTPVAGMVLLMIIMLSGAALHGELFHVVLGGFMAIILVMYAGIESFARYLDTENQQ